tara:strand:- start:8812 stop:9138 length:327 start_codon:yes stop_codon:yes gene_type:complete
MMPNSNVFEGYSDHFDAEVRLIILKALQDEPGKALTDSFIISPVFAEFSIRRDRDYLRTQLKWMETQAGAVRLTQAGTAIIVHLTERGANHLSRISEISGIKAPSLPR